MDKRIFNNIPAAAYTISDTMRQAGFTCYLVGGAVRDLALGLTPKDFDLATDALPDEVEALFPHTIPTGKEFGTITVLIDSIPFEITTFRKEWRDPDGSRKGQMIYSKSLADDLAFRDFTINAMAYDLIDGELSDPYGGMQDLEQRLLRPVGLAEDRFREDALRMMRGVRICAQKGLAMSDELRQAIRRHAEWIGRVSPERIADEIRKILISPRPGQGIADLHKLGMMRVILPELAEVMRLDYICERLAFDQQLDSATTFELTQERKFTSLSDNSPTSDTSTTISEGRFIVRLAILFAPLSRESDGAKTIEQLVDQYRFSNAHKKYLLTLLRYQDSRADSELQLRQLLSHLGSEQLAYWWARLQVQPEKNGLAPEYAELVGRIDSIYRRNTPLQIGDLAISGKDLLEELPLSPGPTLGQLLRQLLDAVLRDPELNERGKLLELAQEYLLKQR